MEELGKAGLFGYVLNLKRGDRIRNESLKGAIVAIPGLAKVIVPPGEEIALSRKGAEVKGDWGCEAILSDGHVVLVLRPATENEDQEGLSDHRNSAGYKGDTHT